MNRGWGVVALAGVLMFGCGGGGKGTDSGGPITFAGAPSTSCEPDVSCDCGSGLTSFTKCDTQGRQSCDCASCPAFALRVPDFQACGGADGAAAAALYGTWVLKSRDVSATRGTFNYADVALGPTTTAVCDSDAHELTDSSMTLLLRNAGSASFQKKSGAVAFSVLASCLTASLPVGCDHFKNCKPGACGLCDCTENAGDFDTDMATWVATGNKLSIDGGAAFTLIYDYCLVGDQLTLADEASREVLTLTRTAKLGSPSACATREAGRCESDGACHLGACVGSGCQPDDNDCSSHAGCTLDALACWGTPKGECEDADYGVVPGCGQSIPLHCGGDAQPCSASSAASGYSAAECEARTGCQAFPSCTGNSTAQTTCADETTSAACTGQGCTWLDFDGCGGTPPSCKSLSDDTCGGSPGCHLSTN
jgi:hypothetical protein